MQVAKRDCGTILVFVLLCCPSWPTGRGEDFSCYVGERDAEATRETHCYQNAPSIFRNRALFPWVPEPSSTMVVAISFVLMFVLTCEVRSVGWLRARVHKVA